MTELQDELEEAITMVLFLLVFCFVFDKAKMFIKRTLSNHTGKDVHKGGCDVDELWNVGPILPTPWVTHTLLPALSHGTWSLSSNPH